MSQPTLVHPAAGTVTRTATPDLLPEVARIRSELLAPLTVRIDREGHYPRQVLQALGEAGAYRQHLPSQGGSGLMAAIEAMASISSECMSTGFMMWCQDALGWYLENSDNRSLRTKLQPSVACGRVLGGTALSNPMKHFSGIEPLQLQGTETPEGFVVSGTLPWVSNLGPDHRFGIVFHAGGREVMAVARCDAEGLSLKQLAHFTGMEGTGTYSCRFVQVLIPHDQVLADPVQPLLKRIKAGFILLQTGMALGLVQGCIEQMRAAEAVLGHVNRYLDDRPDELDEEAQDLAATIRQLAATPHDDTPEYFEDVLTARLAGSELSLRAANSALLHTGARGYLSDAPAQRKVREAYFVAIVTPAIKHLRKELDMLANR